MNGPRKHSYKLLARNIAKVSNRLISDIDKGTICRGTNRRRTRWNFGRASPDYVRFDRASCGHANCDRASCS